LKHNLFTGLPSPPLNPVHQIQHYGRHNLTASVQWGHPENDGGVPVNYTISGTNVIPNVSSSNETIPMLIYNELYTFCIASVNCIGSSDTVKLHIFECELQLGPVACVVTLKYHHVFFFFHVAGCGEPNPPSSGLVENFQSAAQNATITYSCSPGLVPRAQMRAVCTNMSWSPDPAALHCREPPPGN